MTPSDKLEFPSEFIPESFEAGAPFGGVLGRTVELAVFDFLLGFPTKEFNVSDLAREAEISRPSARQVLRKFLEWGILEESSRRGSVEYYRLKEGSLHVEAMQSFVGATNEVMFGLSRTLLSLSGSLQTVTVAATSSSPVVAFFKLDAGAPKSVQETGQRSASPVTA